MPSRSVCHHRLLVLICNWLLGIAICESLSHSAIIPTWHVVLTPVLDDSDIPIALRVQQTLSDFTFDASVDILSLFEAVANQDVGDLDHEGVTFLDARGCLGVTNRSSTSDIGTQRIWTTSRAAIGDIKITYTALPRQDAKPGPVLDLRQDGPGLIGSGFGFLALPIVSDQTVVRTTLEWNLSSTPGHISAVSSQGQASRLIVTESESSVNDLQASFFLVGHLRKAFSEPIPSTNTPVFNIYWFVQPPFDIGELSVVLRDLYSHMKSFFNDFESPFRVFLRHNAHGSLTGTALTNSFAFGWDDSEWSYTPTDHQREAVLAHEMTHDWVLLPGAKVRENWYHEGLAEYYSVLLRYRVGLISAEQYLQEVNDKLTAYYTNPLVKETLADVAKLTWNCSHAQRVPYGRGFAFGLLINGLIKASTSNTHNLDDVVVELAQRTRIGEILGVADYVTTLDSLIRDKGHSAIDYIEDMEAGTLVIPPDNALEPGIYAHITRHDVPAFQLGFEEKSLLASPYILHGLVEGSRAQDAGLRNGDLLAMPYTSLHNHVKDHLDAKMILNVTREWLNGSVQFVVEYWPRTKSLVEAYRYEVDDHLDL